ncbi:MAG: DUF1707 domain-containing protein [Solirubrobacteraceae bacterium]|nr:DUF1707 domain-containing protein [Solirubrobacteraceae bacterium]
MDDPQERPLPDLRASDADRERAVAILGRAASDGRLNVEEFEERSQLAYEARTHAELERLLADVAVEADRKAAPVTRVVPGGANGTSWVVSIMGGSDRKGRWRLAKRCTVINVMGGSDLDLCDAELTDSVTELRVYSLMGGSGIRVPDDVDVQVSKFAFMGGHDVQLGTDVPPPPPGSPVIRIRMISIMGGAEVRRGRKRDRRDGDRDQHRLH